MNNNKTEYNGNVFKRDQYIAQVKDGASTWDVVVIGGGATGLGIAVDAASRGYKTLLLEQSDFSKGTSSRSTKLAHGGVRYLAQGDITLVYEALHERGVMLRNAPHLVKMQSFIIPCYSWADRLKYGMGLKVYDWMAGKMRFHKTSLFSRNKVTKYLPEIRKEGLRGGVRYYDGQFDDARLAINLAQTCAGQGGVLLNYMKVSALLKNVKGEVRGVMAHDLETGVNYSIQSKTVVNATGVFVDDVLKMDAPAHQALVKFSQGVHLVLNKSFLKGDDAIMIPKTPDGRVLFAVPWHDHVVVGTTDTPVEQNSNEPVALQEEIDFILETVGQYLTNRPTRNDILSIFAGLRPLAAPGKTKNTTKDISRGHKLMTASSGLITITGGKWTTYRKMAEDTVDEVIKVGNLEWRPCVTDTLTIHGGQENGKVDTLGYGSDAILIEKLMETEPEFKQKLHNLFPYIKAQVVWAVRHEMARTVEDVLARRLRILFLNARAALEVAPEVAGIMARELGYSEEWIQQQIKEFTILAKNYLPDQHLAEEIILTR